MRSLLHYKEAPSNLLQDLKVTVKQTCFVFPENNNNVPSTDHQKPFFLSNIDQVLNFNVETLHFFTANQNFPPHLVSIKLKEALQKLLVPYHFLSGRLKVKPETQRFEIDCNNGGGAVFAEAYSECRLDELGDLVYPNPAFGQLIHINNLLDNKLNPPPLLIIQMTSFKCGGFAIGISNNHATFDGISFKAFLENIAAVASGKPLAVTPFNDRQLLAARSPPRITFPHPELLKLNPPPSGHHQQQQQQPETTAAIFDLTSENLDFKIFRLTSGDISDLKEKAKSHAGDRVSGFNVVTAHIWRCKALSYGGENEDLERESRILYAVNIRPRMKPPLPDSYAGNAVLTAYASAKCKELKEGPLVRLVEMIIAGAKRVDDEYAKSAIDWGELNRGMPNGEFLVSSWWKLGFEKVEYPWGSPAFSCPLVYHRKDIILLFPDTVDRDGVNVLVALPPQQMAKFQLLFTNFLLD